MRKLEHNFKKILLLLATGFFAAGICASPASAQDTAQPAGDATQEIKYSQDPNAAKNMTLLLKDFEPTSMLHAEAHASRGPNFR